MWNGSADTNEFDESMKTMGTYLKSLDEIMRFFGSDKATSHPIVRDGRGHGYTPVYDSVFTPFREAPMKFLEIGVGSGCSIEGWLEYFTHPATHIYGVDIINTTNPWNTVSEKPDPRYTFVTGDQADDTFWKCFLADHGSRWDIVVDDGGHASNQVITTFKHLWPELISGGLYCIEDLCCAYSAISGFCPDGWQNHMDFVKDMLDSINRGEREIRSIHYSRELAIIQKA